VAIGSDLEIWIPQLHFGARRKEKEAADFSTQGRVVHIRDAETGERVVGVQFTGPRFRRLFQPESAA